MLLIRPFSETLAKDSILVDIGLNDNIAKLMEPHNKPWMFLKLAAK